MMKYLFCSLVSLALGAAGANAWLLKDLNDIQKLGVAADLQQYDKLLTYLESKDIDAALRAQTQFMRLKLVVASGFDHSDWPPHVQEIIKRREGLVN